MNPTLKNQKVTLGVSGSIAAYKAADIASKLTQLGADVHVILTRAAQEFVGAATFRALTLNPVLTSVFDEPYDRKIAHISLAQESDLILVAPATADILAKMAHGFADDLLSSALLAATVPIIVAPAMNSAMLQHPATQENLRILDERGVQILETGFGQLACRTEGYGRLADVDSIIEAVVERLTPKGDMAGLRVLITAGATREPIDPVRFISNRSSGKMGFALAEAAASRGASVQVIAAHTSAPLPDEVEVRCVSTTAEMLQAASQSFDSCDIFIAAAAPADYAPELAADRKHKKSGSGWTLELKETPDILATLAASKGDRAVIGFAAESDDLISNATDKLKRKNLDLIVANDITAEGAGFEVETNIATLLWQDGRQESLPKMTKRRLADRILDEALRLRPPKV